MNLREEGCFLVHTPPRSLSARPPLACRYAPPSACAKPTRHPRTCTTRAWTVEVCVCAVEEKVIYLRSKAFFRFLFSSFLSVCLCLLQSLFVVPLPFIPLHFPSPLSISLSLSLSLSLSHTHLPPFLLASCISPHLLF